VEGLEEIGPERIRELEPRAAGTRALSSPRTGINDFWALARAGRSPWPGSWPRVAWHPRRPAPR